jgi:hypothetical protein
LAGVCEESSIGRDQDVKGLSFSPRSRHRLWATWARSDFMCDLHTEAEHGGLLTFSIHTL